MASPKEEEKLAEELKDTTSTREKELLLENYQLRERLEVISSENNSLRLGHRQIDAYKEAKQVADLEVLKHIQSIRDLEDEVNTLLRKMRKRKKYIRH